MNQARLATDFLNAARDLRYDEDGSRLSKVVRTRLRTSTSLLGPKLWDQFAQDARETLRTIESESYGLTANVAVAVGALQLRLSALHR